jgi:hypothetical protein
VREEEEGSEEFPVPAVEAANENPTPRVALSLSHVLFNSPID